MTIYHTNLAKDYGMSAGFKTAWAGIREILQNALDGNDKGFHMRVEHGKARDRSGEWALKITNEGVTLTRDALLLGFSTKRDDASQRGQHGEGLIVGINALLNNGHEVWIRTGGEAWIAKHVRNERGIEVLVIDIRKQPKVINDFIVEVKNISPQEWEAFQQRMLFFGDKEDRRVETSKGTILMDSKYRNDLFVKGIYVCQLPGEYSFGYNLNIHLNRDREVADPWDLKNTVADAIMEAVSRDLFNVEDVLAVLENERSGESQAFAYHGFWGGTTEFHKKITDNFIGKHGNSAMPVSSMGESARVEHFGKKGVIVSKAVQNIIEKHSGKLDERLSESAMNVAKRYTWGDLEQDERANLTRAMELVIPVEDWVSLDIINIVDFFGVNINGTAKVGIGGEVKAINLAKKIVADKAQVLRTLVHEVGHKYGDDGSNDHENAQYRILSEIIANKLM